MSVPDIYLYTDFGVQGPYLGLMEAAVARICPEVKLTNLMADAPRTDPRRAAYLLAALCGWLPAQAVVVAVVDPGVGGERKMLAMNTRGRWYLGPDNGLLSRLGAADPEATLWELHPDPRLALSASFHGRDIFAPAAAQLACGSPPDMSPLDMSVMVGAGWPDMLSEVIYIDAFGNAMTGIVADRVSRSRTFELGGVTLPRVRTFSDVAPGELFCYENSLGLLEIAANQGSAAEILGLTMGSALLLSRESL
jgi:S-adenosylmethionine hydrolase